MALYGFQTGRIFCANSPSQQARGASYNLLLLLRKDCLFCHLSECYGPPSPSISLETIKSQSFFLGNYGSSKKRPYNNGATLGFETQMFLAADKLRGNLEPSEYKHVVLGLIFLKYISDAFEAKRAALLEHKYADPEAVSYTHLTLPTNREV